jgi:hypothetical protein
MHKDPKLSLKERGKKASTFGFESEGEREGVFAGLARCDEPPNNLGKNLMQILVWLLLLLLFLFVALIPLSPIKPSI